MEGIIDNLEKEKVEQAKDNLELIKIIIESIDNIDYIIMLNNKENNTVHEFIKIKNDLVKKLKDIDVKEINPKAKEKFDNELHIAEESIEENGYEKYDVIEVLKKGYLYKGKVIREAKIIAAK